MGNLKKCERETILLTNEEDHFWNVFTYNKTLQRRLANFAKEHPSVCRFKSQNDEGGVTYEVDKGRLSIRLTAPYSQERIQEASAYGKKHGLNSMGR